MGLGPSVLDSTLGEGELDDAPAEFSATVDGRQLAEQDRIQERQGNEWAA